MKGLVIVITMALVLINVVVYAYDVNEIPMVFVKGGCFEMGDTLGHGRQEERPVHQMCLKDFSIGQYEVTQGLWKEVMGDNPSYFKLGDNYPVDNVSWSNIQTFIERLNTMAGKKYNLPTEAQWEYACRGGGKNVKYAMPANKKGSLSDYAWYDGKSTHPVGQKRPNGLGIHDMSGNVWEMIRDVYNKDAYESHGMGDHVQEGTGNTYVIRGGGWYGYPRGLRCSDRAYHSSVFGCSTVGFRLVLETDVPQQEKSTRHPGN
ncbi:MAG: SUMF1/EgtB/PvdO family nonheme iron enzyme [Nitrospirae bacterium]|nr:SUMF1/EgtB/PvdO family nonheme iron enzyme [Nitrospirota bacterium]